MITQEEIPYTLEEYKAMVKTIAQLRKEKKEKKEMLDKVCEWLKEHMYFTEGISNGEVYYQCNSMESFLNDLKQAMEE